MPHVTIDLHEQRWLCFADPWRERLLARHGGWWSFDGAQPRLEPAPLVGVVGGWLGRRVGWVASALGFVHRWHEGRWHTFDAPALRAARHAVVWGDEHEAWLCVKTAAPPRIGAPPERVTMHASGQGVYPAELVPPPPYFVSQDDDGWLLGGRDAVRRQDGSLWLRAEQLPGDGSRVLDVCRSVDGGHLVVDDAGTVTHRAPNGTLTVRRLGYRGVQWRRMYPDPDPDPVMDEVRSATLLPTGEALLVRERLWRRVDRRGEEHAASGPSPLDALIPDLAPPPRVRTRRLGGNHVEVEVDGTALELRLTHDEDFAPASYLGRWPSGRAPEHWVVQGDELRVSMGHTSIRATLPDPVASMIDGDPWPILIKKDGGALGFDGAWFHRLDLPESRVAPHVTPISAASVSRIGDRLFAANEGRIGAREIVDVARPTALRDAEALEAELAPAPLDLVVRSIPLRRAAAVAQLGALRAVGPTAGGIALTRILAGSERTPGVPHHAELAARVMAGLDDGSPLFLLLADGRMHGWVAAERERALVVVRGEETDRLAAALAERLPTTPLPTRVERRRAGTVFVEGDGEGGTIPLHEGAQQMWLLAEGPTTLLRIADSGYGPGSEVRLHVRLSTPFRDGRPRTCFAEIHRWLGRVWLAQMDDPVMELGGARLDRFMRVDWPSGVPMELPSLPGVRLRFEPAPLPVPPKLVRCPVCERDVRPLHHGGGGHGWFHRELTKRGRMFLRRDDGPRFRCPDGHAMNLDDRDAFLADSVFELYRELRAQRPD